MAELGVCPTCKGKVSTSARACPHCGEEDFYEVKRRTVKCEACKGTGESFIFLFSCFACGGTGKEYRDTYIDRRTGKVSRED
jgi:predicted amidophosphoribosyltransferase